MVILLTNLVLIYFANQSSCQMMSISRYLSIRCSSPSSFIWNYHIFDHTFIAITNAGVCWSMPAFTMWWLLEWHSPLVYHQVLSIHQSLFFTTAISEWDLLLHNVKENSLFSFNFSNFVKTYALRWPYIYWPRILNSPSKQQNEVMEYVLHFFSLFPREVVDW